MAISLLFFAAPAGGLAHHSQKRRRHSVNLMFAALTTCGHVARSSRMMRIISSVPPSKVDSTEVRYQVRMSASASASAIAPRNFATIGSGVPAGAMIPQMLVEVNPEKPDSAIVGTSGKFGNRFGEPTAHILHR